MNASIAKNETLLEVALAPLDFVRQVGLVIGFSLLTALSAQIIIPVPPIPFTAQTFAVVLTGALLGSRLGAITMIVFLRRNRRHLALDGAKRRLLNRISRSRLYHRSVCRARMGSSIPDRGCGDGHWHSGDSAGGLVVVLAANADIAGTYIVRYGLKICA